jgi:hypothetical protein
MDQTFLLFSTENQISHLFHKTNAAYESTCFFYNLRMKRSGTSSESPEPSFILPSGNLVKTHAHTRVSVFGIFGCLLVFHEMVNYVNKNLLQADS